MRFELEGDWSSIVDAFRRMFEGLGVVNADAASVEFSSVAPSVATGIVLMRSGTMAANMPLHSIETVFTEVEFEEDLTALHLIGLHGTYTYRVPGELFDLRSR